MPPEKAAIVKREIKLPLGSSRKLAFILDNVFSLEECNHYIKISEDMDYLQATINSGGQQVLDTVIRNNDRCIWDSKDEAAMIWNRIKDYIPSEWSGRKVVGLNERLRFLRYHPGQYFAPHMDGRYKRDNGECSYITFHAYLNSGFEGGSTTFIHNNSRDPWNPKEMDPRDVQVRPKTGSVLIYQHDVLHEGSEVISGVKYAVRTDIMYAPKKQDTNL